MAAQLNLYKKKFSSLTFGMKNNSAALEYTRLPSLLPLAFGCGGHLGRRAEPPDSCLEENHPMTISSKFSSY
jgi:hypothetical protein